MTLDPKAILDTLPDLVCRFDLGLSFTYANAAAARFFRTDRDALIGTPLIDRVPPEQRRGVRDRFAQLTHDAPTTKTTHRVVRDKGPMWIEWSNMALFEDGRHVGYQSYGHDISSQIILQSQIETQAQSLDRIQAELRAVLDAVPSLIWYKDDQNTILRLNKAAAESMNMSVRSVEGRNTYDLFGASAKAYHDDDLMVIRSGVPMRGKVESFTPEYGEPGWVQTDKIPLLESSTGEPRILVVSTDITALKEQEAMLKTINKNLDDFASLTSHDLQAPLRRIGISAELMELEYGDALPDGAKDYLNDVSEGVRHMRRLIRSFLEFMRASPSGVELDTVDLTKLLHDVAERNADRIEDVEGQLTLPDTQLYVAGEPDLLGQVFSNLIQNAVKYRSPERTLKIQFQCHPDNQFWVIDVIDNGSGIDLEHRDKVFDLFGRSKPHVGVDGSGIGLALCRRIVSMHGGSIDLVTDVTCGSCFRVKLVRKREPVS